jgi:hypothetical protein
MVAVMGVVLLLMAGGVRVLTGSPAQARKTATDTLISWIEQARTCAITTRSIVVLAIAEPGDLAFNDARCHIGILKINEWPADPDTLDGTLIQRWQSLPGGVVIIPGAVNGIRNPRDEPELTIRYRAGNQLVQGRFHILAFNRRGGLLWPGGADPLALRVAEGAYRNNQPSPNTRSTKPNIAENHMQIGRHIGRPYRTDG